MAIEVLIIGAGAAGLAAAAKLSENGFRITILEARDRIGGRIFTYPGTEFSTVVEGGAEFIHGKLKTTLALLNTFKINYNSTAGNWYRVKNGEVEKMDAFIENYKLLEKHLKEMKEDLSVNDFLNFHFPAEEHTAFKESVINFVEGYDAADASRASTLNFKEEWLKDDDDQQYRIEGGYTRLMEALQTSVTSHGGRIHLNAVVKEIRWNKKNAVVVTHDNKKFTASKIVVTVPPPLLYDGRRKAGINFSPPLANISTAASETGYGTVIKIAMEFSEKFWKNPGFKKAGWILSDEQIPTWWTQLPAENMLLTGWIAGPKAEKLSTESDDSIIKIALQSLSSIFKIPVSNLKSMITASKVFNWRSDPYAVGAYSYATLNRLKNIHILNQPVEDILYFAGEALEQDNSGTVEAALCSGFKVANKILHLHPPE
jgi:monoamine oxidase